MAAYHLVCHECTEEAILTERRVAQRRREDHVDTTDHDVSVAAVERRAV